MKNIKIILTTCVVVLTTGLIWTGCQKQNPVINNNIDSSNINKSNPEQSKKYLVESYSEITKSNIRANIIENGNGKVIINTRSFNSKENKGKSVFSIGSPLNEEQKPNLILDEEKYWLIKLNGENPDVQRIGRFGQEFNCICNGTGTTNGCAKTETSPQKGVFIYDCNATNCDRGCRGQLTVTTGPGIANQDDEGDEKVIDLDFGYIIIEAKQLVLNGKLFQ